MTTRKTLWQEMTRREIDEASRAGFAVIIATGAIEQHGPHLPVDTDISCSYELAKRIAEEMENVLVAPPVWWGYAPMNSGFPGLLTVRIETFLDLLRDICTSMLDQGFRKIFLLNGHGPNEDLLRLLVQDIRRTHDVPIACASWYDLAAEEIQRVRDSGMGGIGHAGELETSMQLFLRGEGMLDMASAKAHYIDPVEDFGSSFGWNDMFGRGMVYIGLHNIVVNPLGIYGDPTLASAEKGEHIAAAVVDNAVAFLEEYIDRCDAP